MSELASKEQLRMSFVRWALVTVPVILFCGFFIGQLSNSGFGNRWFDALIKPFWFPPGWAFGLVWSILYIMLGISIAMILHARGAKGRGAAISLFFGQLLLNFIWSPTFFIAHQVTIALFVIVLLTGLAIATYFLFRPIRRTAALLMLPYIAWLCFATLINFEINRLNPDAETFVAPARSTEIIL
jgi:translocator protein